MRIGNIKIDFPVFLAPMAGISNICFRTLMIRMGAGCVVTELLSSEALKRKNRRTVDMMRIHPDERPCGVQIFGHDANAMAESAKMVADAGADFVDINLGCPVKKITKQGAGAKLLEDLPTLKKILRAVQAGISVPLTIKIRTGFTDDRLTYRKVIELAEDEGVAMVAIHGRSRQQAYEGKANWDVIADAKKHARLPIVGNGDLVSAEVALSRWRESGADGIMIGRGALRNPWIFRQIRALLAGDRVDSIEKNLSVVLRHHVELLREFETESRMALQLKKFLAWYFTNMPGVAAFRQQLFELSNTQDIIDAATGFLSHQQQISYGIAADERFLMGGHG